MLRVPRWIETKVKVCRDCWKVVDKIDSNGRGGINKFYLEVVELTRGRSKKFQEIRTDTAQRDVFVDSFSRW